MPHPNYKGAGVAAAGVIPQDDAKAAKAEAALGGEAPKRFVFPVIDDKRVALIQKFARDDHGVNDSIVEFSCYKLVNGVRSQIGDKVPGYDPSEYQMTRMFRGKNRDYVAVERFDCDEQGKTWASIITLAEVAGFNNSVKDLGLDAVDSKRSYSFMAKEFSERAGVDLGPEIYTRMLTNIALSNTDDHAQNHALLVDRVTCETTLSPVFDVVSQQGWGGSSVLKLGPFGNEATTENLYLSAKEMLGDNWQEKALAIAQATLEATKDWKQEFIKNGLTEDQASKFDASIGQGQGALESFVKRMESELSQSQGMARSKGMSMGR